MVLLSKEAIELAIGDKVCKDIMHPWASSCAGGIAGMCLSCCTGAFKFSLALHTLQLLSKGKNLTKHHFTNILIQMLRLAFLGPCIGLAFSTVSCLQRKLLGGYFYYSCLTVPGMAAGATIFVLNRSRRHYVISAFCTALLETLVHHYTPLKDRKKFVTFETLFFMVINGAFLYLVKLWKTNKTDQSMPEIWFYSASGVPNKLTGEEKKISKHHPCDHLHSCFKSILKETSNYFWFGTILEILRITISNFKSIVKNPKLIMKFIFKKSTLRLATFAGLYVFLYKVTNCLMCRLSGKDNAFNALLSGFVSGLSYYLHPSLSLSLTAFTNLIHILWRYFNVNTKFIGNRDFPSSEIVFMIVCGLLFHYRMTAPESSSKFFINVLSIATGGRSDEIYNHYRKFI